MYVKFTPLLSYIIITNKNYNKMAIIKSSINKKTNTYLCKINTTDEYSDCQWAIITLDKKLKDKHRLIKPMFEMMKNRVEGLYKFSFWWYDNIHYIHNSLEEELGIEDLPDKDDYEIYPIKDLTKKDEEKIAETEDRAGNDYITPDCSQFAIYEDGGIIFSCYLKHCDIKLETTTIESKYFE